MTDPADRARAEHAAARAAAAKRLMDDPLLMEAFENVRLGAIKAWRATPANDEGVKAREVAWLTVKVVDRVETELQNIIDNGAIAASRVQAPLR
jgi:hypothetical protein